MTKKIKKQKKEVKLPQKKVKPKVTGKIAGKEKEISPTKTDAVKKVEYPDGMSKPERYSRFPIIGLGASAGGLEACEMFLKHLPADSGVAVIIMLHLAPDRSSLLSEILGRVASIPVIEAEDQMKVQKNHVYIILPNHDIAIFNGALHLSVPEEIRGHRMPIDFFFRSLAEELEEKSIGIIFSGSGSDGTIGLRAIIGAGGVSFVQEPGNAKYDGMPLSAIRNNLATYILPFDKIADELINYVKVFFDLTINKFPLIPAHQNSINKITMLLRSKTGNDFSFYKQSTIHRRIRRRMTQHNIDDFNIYIRYLQENPGEVKQLFKEILINVTSFFRDPEAFDVLKTDILPLLFNNKDENYIFRIWVPACATGEEAYSIAMVLREYMDEIKQEFQVQIYSTDIDESSIDTARSGRYPSSIVMDVSQERIRRFFTKEENGFRIKKDIREMIIFAVQNITKDPPFTKLDLVSCRNLLIYLDPVYQEKLILSFHYALRQDGILFLGPSESIGNSIHYFSSINRKWKFYGIKNSITPVSKFFISEPFQKNPKEFEAIHPIKLQKDSNFNELVKIALLNSFAPPSVVTDEKGNILYIYGDTGKYLRPAPGQASLNIIEMAKEGLQSELRKAINCKIFIKKPHLSTELMVKINGGKQMVIIRIKSLSGSETLQKLLLISFQESRQTSKEKSINLKEIPGKRQLKRNNELEQELLYLKENLQSHMEEYQASIEELKSTNEELQSTNEELQSTNEELETSKEEIQSVNEELMTVNAELQSKIEQLTEIQNDLKNLLDNTNSGIIILNQNITIKRFNREATKVYRLLPTDIGRPLSDINSTIENFDLISESIAVLDSLIPREIEVHTNKDIWYMIKIMPYRTLDNVIDGTVLIFTEITDLKIIQKAAVTAREYAENIIDTIREPLIVLNDELKIVSASKSFFITFNMLPNEVISNSLYTLGEKQWDFSKLRQLLQDVTEQDTFFENIEMENDFPHIGHRKFLLNARHISGRIGKRAINTSGNGGYDQ